MYGFVEHREMNTELCEIDYLLYVCCMLEFAFRQMDFLLK